MTPFYLIVFVFLSNFCSIRGDVSVCFDDDFYCTISRECIPLRLRCNGVSDCHFGEDEKGCSCVSWCDKNKRCVLRRERCNGIVDCLDKSDEANCSSINCVHDRFPCELNGTTQCLDVSLRCDGTVDCGDGTDEKNCDKTTSAAMLASKNQGCEGESFCPFASPVLNNPDCPLSSRLASTFRLETNAHILVRKCDTIPQCPLGEDEINCPKTASETVCSLGNNLFLCTNGQCISTDQVCDGFTQCSDGSDEFVQHCLVKFKSEEPDAYRADDKCPFRCRLPVLGSNSTSEKAALMMPYSRFCIPLEQVCDGEADCPFGDDEKRLELGCAASDEIRYVSQKCGSNGSNKGGAVLECDPISTDCIVTQAFGPICACKPGFRPISQSVTRCVDMDECSMGACEHFCENLLGSFACGCRDGYHLTPGSCQRCEASSAEEEPYFIFSTPSLIYRLDEPSQMTRINLYHAEMGQVRPPWSGPIPFDYARNDDLLVFYSWGAIRAKVGHSSVEPWVFLNVDHDITWLAYDDLNNNLYFNGHLKDGGYFWRVFYVGIVREKNQVTSVSRASEVKTVVEDTTSGVTTSNLVLDPEMGLMFFTTTTSGNQDRLAFCALNGDDLKTVPWQFEKLRSLSVDRSGGFLYIFDAGRRGLAHVQILANSSPASLGDLAWIEERRSFFGPKPFISFSSSEFDSQFYFLAGEIINDKFKTSFQSVNKSSLMAFEASAASPFSLIPSASLLLNTSFFRVRNVGPSLRIDACFHERQHVCETHHICLSRPPPPGQTSAFTRAVCECPDSMPNCQRRVVPIRANFMPPGRPSGSLDEFRERQECANFVLGTPKKKRAKLQQQDTVVIDSKASDLALLGPWPANVTGESGLDLNGESDYDALKSSGLTTEGTNSLFINLTVITLFLFLSLFR